MWVMENMFSSLYLIWDKIGNFNIILIWNDIEMSLL